MKLYYLVNVKDNEICDVFADSLESAKQKASEILGGKAEDYNERF